MNIKHIRHIDILSVKIHALNYTTAVEVIQKYVSKKKKAYVCVSAVHLIMECQKNNRLIKAVNNAALVTPDGMPLVWLLRLYGIPGTSRVYGPMLMHLLCHKSQRNGYTVYFVGGHRGQSKKLKEKLLEIFPGIKIVGHCDTPKRPLPKTLHKHLLQDIKKKKPDIIFVGLGCPWQELWMADCYKHISYGVLIGVGAAFDYISGSKKQAPHWMQKRGLEWLFRLIQEPKRLFYRYTVLNIVFCIKIFKQLLSERRLFG